MSGSPELAVGLLGTSFMGRAHSRGLLLLPTLEDEPAALPRLAAICGRDRGRADAIARRFGWERVADDWQELVHDPDIAVFDNATPNHLHAEPCIAAAQAGKHVICEKPLGRSSEEARQMLDAVELAGVVNMCAFNYRFFPAIRLAHALLQARDLGDIYHFRSRFLIASGALEGGSETEWRLRRESAGSGVVGDLLSHHIDLARYLIGEPVAVSAVTRTWASERHGVDVDVDDAVVVTIEFENGAVGTLEATRMTPGHVLESTVEIDGAKGSLAFDVQRLNELRHSTRAGSTMINVTEAEHPFIDMWWPRGQGLGWGDSFIHELRHFLGACVGAWDVAPHGATFEDGYRCALVCDAVLAAAASGRRVEVGTEGELEEADTA